MKLTETLPHCLNQVDDYRQLAEACDRYVLVNNLLSTNFSVYVSKLDSGLDDELAYINTVDDISSLEDCILDIERVSEVFGGDMQNRIYEIQDKINELIDEQEEDEPEQKNEVPREPPYDDTDTVISLFQTLIE